MSMLKALLKSMRPRQWTKNIFIFAALVFDRKLDDPKALGSTILGFILFCLLSSVVYLLNDLGDIEADRNHPEKRKRPLASGILPAKIAWLTVAGLLVIILPLAFWLSIPFGLITSTYFLLNLAYTKWLKHVPLIDVLTLASFYVIRVGAGVVLVGVERFSPWLYMVTTMLALFIGLGKRRSELSLLADDANSSRKVLEGYSIPFLDHLIIIVSATTIMAYSLYTFSAPNLPENHAMMLTIPFVVYGIFRYLYLLHFDKDVGAPEEVVLTDRPLQVTMVAWMAAIFAIFYLFPSR
jgi:4-hydroxybenzoate polyprenyltransferase